MNNYIKNNTGILIRIDDVCENMDWEILFKQLLNELSISYKALIIGVIGGYIGTLIGLPLPWLLGALGLNLCIAFTNFKIEFSTKLLNPVFLMVGIILGGSKTKWC